MKTHSDSKRWQVKPAYFLAAAILIGALFLIFPKGRALAQDILRFFNRAARDTIPAPTSQPLNWVGLTPGAPAITHTPAMTLTIPGQTFFADCGDIRVLRCSVAQIRSKVSFPIQELGIIPEGMQFTGATGSQDTVWIVYDRAANSGRLLLIQEPWKNSPEQRSWTMGASATVETVPIGSVTGEYVKGSFTYKSGETQQQWDENADVQTLRWEEDGIFTVLEYIGDDAQLGQDGLAALAATLTTEPITARIPSIPATATPTEEIFDLQKTYPLTVQEARQQAGFTVREPTRLPDILSYFGAAIEDDPAHNPIIALFYRLDQKWGPNMNGVGIREQKIPKGGACRLCGFVVGQYTGVEPTAFGKTVGANATIQSVQISNTPGQYVEGVWKGTDQGWVYDPDPYLKTLRWHANGMAFEITYFGEEITQEDMIAIAESMK